MIPSILQSAYYLRRAIRNAAIVFAVSFFVGLGLALGGLAALSVLGELVFVGCAR